MVNQSVMKPLMATYKVVTGYIGYNAQDHWVAGLKMN